MGVIKWKKVKVKVTQCLNVQLFATHGLYSPWNSPGQNTGVGSHSLFQEIFPTQGSNPGLPHFRQILYLLSHQGSSRILEWVAYPFSADLPDPGIELGSPALQVDSLPTELYQEAEGWGKFLVMLYIQKRYSRINQAGVELLGKETGQEYLLHQTGGCAKD